MLQVKPGWKRWKLLTRHGKQIWAYKPSSKKIDEHLANSDHISDEEINELKRDFNFDKGFNPNSGDAVFRSSALENTFTAYDGEIPATESTEDQAVITKLIKGIHYFKHLQSEDGHWPGDYGGPLFLLPGLIIASYMAESPFPRPHREMMKIYLYNHQNEDGGWGMHIEGHSTMFGTVMQYVSLRLLGEDMNDSNLVNARAWIQNNGGATGIPSWGKFYLSILNLYDWQGFNSLFPEIWLFPKWLPLHPWRYWCHTRMVYLPMAYCYGQRISMPENDLILSLRKEIHTQDFGTIDWTKTRDYVCEKDIYTTQSPVLKVMNFFTNGYEKFRLTHFRRKAMNYILTYLDAEDQQTAYLDIGPVSQAINSICIWHKYGSDSERFKKHVSRWYDYLWVAEDGMKMTGYNGSQLWDTTFTTRAILESDIGRLFKKTLSKSYNFIELSQIMEQHPTHDQFFRHPMIGSWPFSTAEQGWPVADCTAEGLSATLALHNSGLVKPLIDHGRIKKAVDVILSYQNQNGGWPTYELSRAPEWLEKFNPSEVFADIMIDYSWTECSSACIQSLIEFQESFPDYKKTVIHQAIEKGLKFIIAQQRDDGSWYGGWAVCFTYATWFGIEALSKARATGDFNHPDLNRTIDQGVNFLIQKKKTDGGWGETFESCSKKVYSEATESQVVNTSWALLGLMSADFKDQKTIQQGIQLLLDRQDEVGDWQQENISGVFNYNCMITYSAYRNTFPIWALNRYYQKYLC